MFQSTPQNKKGTQSVTAAILFHHVIHFVKYVYNYYRFNLAQWNSVCILFIWHYSNSSHDILYMFSRIGL